MPLGPGELGIILVIVVVIFGAGKLAQVGGALRQSVREFKATVDETESTPDEQKTPPHPRP